MKKIDQNPHTAHKRFDAPASVSYEAHLPRQGKDGDRPDIGGGKPVYLPRLKVSAVEPQAVDAPALAMDIPERRPPVITGDSSQQDRSPRSPVRNRRSYESPLVTGDDMGGVPQAEDGTTIQADTDSSPRRGPRVSSSDERSAPSRNHAKPGSMAGVPGKAGGTVRQGTNATQFEPRGQRTDTPGRSHLRPPDPAEMDAAILQDVQARLDTYPDADTSGISVRVQNAVVRIEGAVNHRSIKHAIEYLIEASPNVRDIENLLRVEPGDGIRGAEKAGPEITGYKEEEPRIGQSATKNRVTRSR